ncbi:YwqG family protein [Streptomyces sp. NPDC050263]|uniref:YwqG family protein n=1 Tax=Streptomyces sp. NPDC050263 TaxID=3155037 RepID=UPI00343C8FA8
MTDERYSRLAAEHLPGDLAQRWTALLRPCIRLRRAVDGERTVAALGGHPELPAGADWPEWPGHGPLSFIASVRCAALPREGRAEQFPQDGTLLFFYFDGRTAADAFVSAVDPETWAGAQVLYIPADTPVFPADTPPESEAFPRVDLTADTEQSAPDRWLPQSRKALLGDSRDWPPPREIPAELKPFLRAFERLRGHMGHQIGGHAVPVQGPAEYEIAYAALGGVSPWGDRPHDEEAERWVLLAQFDSDSDAKMTWGDAGALYWLIRPEDLAAHRFDQARLTVQC